MKKLLLIIILSILGTALFAQTPQKMSYQAVIRDGGGLLVSKTQIGMQINIRQGSPSGNVVYTEIQTPTTNANGLVSIEIGAGAGFSTINWASDSYYIETKTAVVPPLTTYTITGVSQLLSVPYALHTKTAENVTGTITETDPLWTTASVNYYTKNNMQTSGSSQLHFNNLTNKPTTLAGYGITNAMNTSHAANGITATNITNWTTAYGWGNHATAGYLLNYTETDPTWNGTANQTGDIGRTGNVGIGTTTPTQKLDIDGQVRIRGGAPGAGKVLTSDANGNATWLAAGGIGTVTSVASNNGITGGPITSTGTLGLTGNALGLHNLNTNGLVVRTAAGTIASRSIDMSGNGISVSNGDGVSGNPTLSLNFGSGSTQVAAGNHTHSGLLPSGSTNQTLRYDGSNWVANSTLFNDGTNIGIGTLTPTTKLEVKGTVKTTGNTTYGFYSDMNTGSALGYGGYFKHTTSGDYSYGVYGESNYTGVGNPSRNCGGYFKSNSTSQVGYGVYSVAIKTNTTADVDATGVYGVGQVLGGNNGDSYGIKGYASGGNNAFGVYGQATSGVNTWAGYFNGNVNITSTLTTRDLKLSCNDTYGVGKVLTSDATGNATWETPATATESDPTWNGTANQTGDIGRTGNVGIGTSTPTAKLEVNGSVKATGNTTATIEVINTATSNTSYSGFFSNASSDGRGLYSTSTATTGVTTAGYFENESTTGRGITSYAKATSGNSIAGYFESKSTSGKGIVSYASATTGTTYGIRSHVASPDGYSGYFYGGKFYIGGNVGIGTETPTAQLHTTGTLCFAGAGTPGTGKILTSDANGIATWQTISALPSGSTHHTLRHDGANWLASSSLYNTGTSVGIGISNPAELLHVKNAAGSAKMRLQSTDVSSIEFYNNTAYMAGIGVSVSQGHFFIYNGGNVSVKDGSLGIGNVAPAQKLDITGGNGRVQSGYSWLTNSDVRYKTNITTIENALQRIAKLRGVRYDLKEEKSIVQGQGKHIGFIAQELEKEFPEFVVADKNGYKSVAYDKMTAVLLQAMNEQQTIITTQQTDIQQLKQLLEQQQVQITTLINKTGQQK